MEKVETKQIGFAWRAAVAALAPFAVESAYLFFTRWPSSRFTTFSDYAGLSVSVLAGAVFVARLPIRPVERVVLLLVYVPTFAGLLFIYSFFFSRRFSMMDYEGWCFFAAIRQPGALPHSAVTRGTPDGRVRRKKYMHRPRHALVQQDSHAARRADSDRANIRQAISRVTDGKQSRNSSNV